MKRGHQLLLLLAVLNVYVLYSVSSPSQLASADITLTLSKIHISHGEHFVVSIIKTGILDNDDSPTPVPFDSSHVNRINVDFLNLRNGQTVRMQAVEAGADSNIYLLIVTAWDLNKSLPIKDHQILQASDGDSIIVSHGAVGKVLQVDYSPPKIDNLVPHDHTTINPDDITFSAEITDSFSSFTSDILEISKQLHETGIITLAIMDIEIPNNMINFMPIPGGWNISYTAPLGDFPIGTTVRWSVSATDRAGNAATTTPVLLLSSSTQNRQPTNIEEPTPQYAPSAEELAEEYPTPTPPQPLEAPEIPSLTSSNLSEPGEISQQVNPTSSPAHTGDMNSDSGQAFMTLLPQSPKPATNGYCNRSSQLSLDLLLVLGGMLGLVLRRRTTLQLSAARNGPSSG